jgi:hypothetical protein
MITNLTVPDDCIKIPYAKRTLPMFVAVPSTFMSRHAKKELHAVLVQRCPSLTLAYFSDQRFDEFCLIRINIVLAGSWRDLQWSEVGVF